MHNKGIEIRERFSIASYIVFSTLVYSIVFFFFAIIFLILERIEEAFGIIAPYYLLILGLFIYSYLLYYRIRSRKWYYLFNGYIIIRSYFRHEFLAKSVIIYFDKIQELYYWRRERVIDRRLGVYDRHFWRFFKSEFSTTMLHCGYLLKMKKNERRFKDIVEGKGRLDRTYREFRGRLIAIPDYVIKKYMDEGYKMPKHVREIVEIYHNAHWKKIWVI